MDLSGIGLALLNMKEAQRASVLNNAAHEYGLILTLIYNDIYESCIKVYYGSYTPSVYRRHGDEVGFNLYSAFSSQVLNLRVDAETNAEMLMPYGRGISKEQVLNAVIHGQRGLKHRVAPKTGVWPKSWAVSYPNQYSQYNMWTSTGDTIDAILIEFHEAWETGADETLRNIFWELVRKQL